MKCRHILTIEDRADGKHFGTCSCGWSTGPESCRGQVRSDHRAHINQRTPLCGTCDRRHVGVLCPEGIKR